MFTSVDDARAFLVAEGLAKHAERLLGYLLPCLTIAPAPADRLGGTRLGGVPDLPPGLDWPVRPVPPDAEAFAARYGTHQEWIGRHIRKAQPYEFVAAIELAEAATLSGAAALPSEGRLLFFYDGAVGPWWDGPEAGRVIWDPSPVTALAEAAGPAALAELHAAELAEHAATQADPMRLAKGYSATQLKIIARTLKAGETLADHFAAIAKDIGFTSRYVHPRRPMRVVPGLQWPDTGSPEAAASATLQALVDQGVIAYLSTLSRASSPQQSLPHILLGVPVAEQDDPRYDAAFRADPGLLTRLQANRDAVWPEVEARAADWTLLLQIDQADLMQGMMEGTVYYVIRKPDLAARDFSRVEVIYQQT
jgi:Domain of unknown function (DUF1963)